MACDFLWEYREAMRQLRNRGKREVNETIIFETIVRQREIVLKARMIGLLRDSRVRANLDRRRRNLSQRANSPESISEEIETILDNQGGRCPTSST